MHYARTSTTAQTRPNARHAATTLVAALRVATAACWALEDALGERSPRTRDAVAIGTILELVEGDLSSSWPCEDLEPNLARVEGDLLLLLRSAACSA